MGFLTTLIARDYKYKYKYKYKFKSSKELAEFMF